MLGFSSADAQDFAAQRARMVAEVEAMYAETRSETGLAAMSPAVRRAMGKVERHRLVPSSETSRAYRNHPLPIGGGPTISGNRSARTERETPASRARRSTVHVSVGRA